VASIAHYHSTTYTHIYIEENTFSVRKEASIAHYHSTTYTHIYIHILCIAHLEVAEVSLQDRECVLFLLELYNV
jgi:hypothetical protein